MCSGQGDRQRAIRLLTEAGDIYQDLGDQWLGSNILNEVAWETWNHGNPRKGRELIENLLSTNRLSRAVWDKPIFLGTLANMSLTLGDYPAAQEYARESLEIRRNFSVAVGEAWGIFDLGKVAFTLGNLELARQHFTASLKIQRKFQNKHGVSLCLSYLGIILVHEGDLKGGLVLLEEGREIHSDLENTNDSCVLENSLFLAQAVQRLGDYAHAAALMRNSLQLTWNTYNLPALPPRMEGLAASGLGLKQYRYSATLLGAADQQRKKMETPIFPVDRPAYEETLSRLKDGMSDEEFNQAWQAGTAMALDEIVAYALSANDG